MLWSGELLLAPEVFGQLQHGMDIRPNPGVVEKCRLWVLHDVAAMMSAVVVVYGAGEPCHSALAAAVASVVNSPHGQPAVLTAPRLSMALHRHRDGRLRRS